MTLATQAFSRWVASPKAPEKLPGYAEHTLRPHSQAAEPSVQAVRFTDASSLLRQDDGAWLPVAIDLPPDLQIQVERAANAHLTWMRNFLLPAFGLAGAILAVILVLVAGDANNIRADLRQTKKETISDMEHQKERVMELERSIPTLTTQAETLHAQAETLKAQVQKNDELIQWVDQGAPEPDVLQEKVDGLSKVLRTLAGDERGKLLKALECMERLEAALPSRYPLASAELRIRAGSTATSVQVHAAGRTLPSPKTKYSGEGVPVEQHWPLANLPAGWVKLDVLVESQPLGLVLNREIWSGSKECIFNETLRQPPGGPGSNMTGYAGSDNIRFTNILWVWSDGGKKYFSLVR